MSRPRKTVAVVSGGMDSITLAYLLKAQDFKGTKMISFDYGQRHKKELEFAKQAADDLGFVHEVIDLSGITRLLTGSALTDASIEVPEGHYADDSMRLTVVPNRNMMMISIAWAIAISDEAELVAIGVHAGDHFIYPDCRPAFVQSMEHTLQIANEGFGRKEGMELWAPFLYGDKARIAEIGRQVGVPYEKTWSCYKGGEKHCGKCGTCVERKEALTAKDHEDPTEYEA